MRIRLRWDKRPAPCRPHDALQLTERRVMEFNAANVVGVARRVCSQVIVSGLRFSVLRVWAGRRSVPRGPIRTDDGRPGDLRKLGE